MMAPTLATNGTLDGQRGTIGRIGRMGGVAAAAALVALLALLITANGTLALPTSEINNRAQRLKQLCVEATGGEASTTATSGANGQVTSVTFTCSGTSDGRDWSCQIGGANVNCTRNAPPIRLNGRGGSIGAQEQVQATGNASDPPVVGDPVPRVDGGETHQLAPDDDSQDALPPADTGEGGESGTADDPKPESEGDDSAQGSSAPGGQVIITAPVEEADDATISGKG